MDETAFQLWIAPEPSEVATVYTEKILAEAPLEEGDELGPSVPPPLNHATVFGPLPAILCSHPLQSSSAVILCSHPLQSKRTRSPE